MEAFLGYKSLHLKAFLKPSNFPTLPEKASKKDETSIFQYGTPQIVEKLFNGLLGKIERSWRDWLLFGSSKTFSS